MKASRERGSFKIIPAELPQQGAEEAAGGGDTAGLGPGEGSSPAAEESLQGRQEWAHLQV